MGRESVTAGVSEPPQGPCRSAMPFLDILFCQLLGSSQIVFLLPWLLVLGRSVNLGGHS